jgi:hypothetical protein
MGITSRVNGKPGVVGETIPGFSLPADPEEMI